MLTKYSHANAIANHEKQESKFVDSANGLTRRLIAISVIMKFINGTFRNYTIIIQYVIQFEIVLRAGTITQSDVLPKIVKAISNSISNSNCRLIITRVPLRLDFKNNNHSVTFSMKRHLKT